MNGRCSLDTNILIALFAGDSSVRQELNQTTEVLISSVVLGELYYGARKSSRVEANVQRVDELAASSAILDCDVETAQHYAIIKNHLKLKGKPIPENDMGIAAAALQHNLILVTRDTHFQDVENLTTASW